MTSLESCINASNEVHLHSNIDLNTHTRQAMGKDKEDFLSSISLASVKPRSFFFYLLRRK